MKDISMNPAFKMLTTPPELRTPSPVKIPSEDLKEIAKPIGGTPLEDFSNILEDSIKKVNGLQNDADEAIRKMAMGEPQELHDTIIAIQQASTSFKLMMEVRNKLIDAYKEVMNMRV